MMSIKRSLFRLKHALLGSKKIIFLVVFILLFGTLIYSHSSLNNEAFLREKRAHPKNVLGDNSAIEKLDKPVIDKPPSLPQTVFIQGEPGIYEPAPDAKAHDGPGERGKPVKTDLSSKAVRDANLRYGFNTVASDLISLNRTIPDTRPKECKYWHYPDSLPTASVVIVFHNEGWSPLLRTVHSVLNRSPPHLLREVLMIDDFSTLPHLKQPLEGQVAKYNGKVRLLRNDKREGLIGSRSRGGKEAYGEVVIFLDAHCEVNTNWLPPLLGPIAENRKVMTVPYIDGIDMGTWEYRPQYAYSGTGLFRGIFEWGLLYKESEIPAKELKVRKQKSEPLRAPTHAGGLFAIDKAWFKQLGYYDAGLLIWGGENFELSFKIWMCGGGVLWVPCSRVGHVYRNHMPYNFGGLSGPVISTNYKRVAEVWMDEYAEYYYRREPFMRHRDPGNLTEPRRIRKENNCKPFKWFMENVAYDVPLLYPLAPENHKWGELVSKSSQNCLDTMGRGVMEDMGTSGCHHSGGNQLYRLNVEGQIATGEWCVRPKRTNLVRGYCDKGTVNGPWKYDEDSLTLMDTISGKCLTEVSERSEVFLKDCSLDSLDQQWIWNELKI